MKLKCYQFKPSIVELNNRDQVSDMTIERKSHVFYWVQSVAEFPVLFSHVWAEVTLFI